jgi:hypothetical protein
VGEVIHYLLCPRPIRLEVFAFVGVLWWEELLKKTKNNCGTSSNKHLLEWGECSLL